MINPRTRRKLPPTGKRGRHTGSKVLSGFSPPVLAEIEGIESKKEEDKILPRGTQSSRLEEPVYTLSYKQLHFRPPEPQIFENRSNLASNCRASNR